MPALLVGLTIATISGCGNGTAKGAKSGAIVITGANGAAVSSTSISVDTTIKFSMAPSGDVIGAGVDWVVACGGNPFTGSVTNGACGTFTPVHTADGAPTVFTAPSVVPIGTTITITASVTSNPAQTSAVSLTILQLPIVVTFTQLVPPASVKVNQAIPLAALVTNDPASAGVIWSATCGATACGSFNPTTTASSIGTTYTAPPSVPSGGSVTITATSLTDTTKSVSATFAITVPSPPQLNLISVAVSPATFYAQTTGAARVVGVSAVVTNDSAAAGVNWTLTCGASSCGTITPHSASGQVINYIAPSTVPPAGTVTLTAASTTDPTVSAVSIATIVTTPPIVITIPTASALPSTLMPAVSATLAATVANDANSLGVNWAISCGQAAGCGSFNLAPAHTVSGGKIVYTAPSSIPAGAVVTITASSPATTPSNPAVTATTIIAAPPAISFLQSPPFSLISTSAASISAVVTNDVAPGGVTWSVQCASTVPGGCGYVLPSHTASGATATYTAPPVTTEGTSVTLVATSTADPQVSVSSTTPIVIHPSSTLSVDFVPIAPSQIQTGATVNLSAAVTNDSTNAGVDWQVCASGCGFFTTQQPIAAIAATAATPYIPAVPAVTATTVKGWPNNLSLPYTAPTAAPKSGSVVMVVASDASPLAANSATVVITPGTVGPALHGLVRAGSQPVIGALVGLYAAGTAGYASVATSLFAASGSATVSTDSAGSFTLPAGYSCPQVNSQVYLVATGGEVGSNEANPNLALMTALGSCGALSSSTVVVNEATSVAAAYATAPFASNGSLTGESSYLYLGTSNTNLTGLMNAFAAANNLVDIATGQPRFIVPSGNAFVPYVEINTLADLLNACIASSGGAYGDSSPCGLLFTYAAVLVPNTLPTSFPASAPSDTLQAIFNIAEHPGFAPGGSGGYYELSQPNYPVALVTDSSPYQPKLELTTGPNDWSVSLNYRNGGGLSSSSVPGSFAVDAQGDLWITDTNAGIVAELNPVGAALSPSSGFPAAGGPIAIDAAGDVWVSGAGSLSELTSLGLPVPGSPFAGVAGGGGDMSVDAQGNLWITTGSGVAEFNSLGAELSPSTGYANPGLPTISAVGVDSSNNVWLGGAFSVQVSASVTQPGQLAELTNPGGQLIVLAQGGIATGLIPLPGMAADGNGDIWSALGGSFGPCTVTPYAGIGTPLVPNCPSFEQTGIAQPSGVAIDGAGVIWTSNAGGQNTSTLQPLPVAVTPFNTSLQNPEGPNYMAQSLAAGTLRVAVDGSGNVWVLLANGSVTEYVGLATPVVTPVALGLKTKKLAAKP